MCVRLDPMATAANDASGPFRVEHPTPTSIWSRKVHGAAIACALDFVCAHEWTVTGYASVMSLNPYGAPKTIRSLAVVVQDGSDPMKAAQALCDYLSQNYTSGLSAGSAAAASAKTPIHVDARCVDTLGMFIIKAGDAQLVTLTALSLTPMDVLWKALIRHDARTWLAVQYTPACLRAHLFYTCAFALVRSLDGFIAERCLWGMNDGLVTRPPPLPLRPSAAAPAAPDEFLSEVWALATEWADALVGIHTVEDLSLPSFLVLEDLVEVHREALCLHYEEGMDPLRAFCTTHNPAAFLALVFLGKPRPFLEHSRHDSAL